MEHRLYKDVILASLCHLSQQDLKDKKRLAWYNSKARKAISSRRLKLYKSEENKKEQALASTVQSKIIQKCLRNNLQTSKI